MTRRELDEDEWVLIGPLLPVGRFGPHPQRLRDQLEGVTWRFRTGSQRREMPAEFGRWQTVYDAFIRWRDAGVFGELMDAMIAEAARREQLDLSLVSVDSTSVRAHQDAAGMRVDLGVLDALEKAAAGEKGRQHPDKRHSWPRRNVPLRACRRALLRLASAAAGVCIRKVSCGSQALRWSAEKSPPSPGSRIRPVQR